MTIETLSPGPWSIKWDDYAGYDCMSGAWELYDKDGEFIDALETSEKNSRLIAAAPELLECLEEAMDLLDACTLPEERKKFKEVIAKANGDK